MADEPGVVITIKDIYDEMRSLITEVRGLTQSLQAGKTVDDDHEKRIRVIERWMYGIPAAVLIAIAGAVIQITKG